MTTEVKDVLDRLLHFHFNNVEEHRGGGPMVQMDKASLREANALFVEAYNALRAAESRATAAEGRVALLEEERDTRSEGWSAFLTENAGNISDLNDQVRTLSSALELQVEQAFRDGLAYATKVKLARPEEHDIAWLQSQARARLAKGGQ